MPEKNGKHDTQNTERGYEIPVPKRKDVFGLLDKAATKDPAKAIKRKPRKRSK